MISKADEILQESVLSPWEKACRDSEYPWRATPELRTEWGRMIHSEDKSVALAGAFGLARITNPSSGESSVVEDYFNRLVDIEFSFDALAVGLLSGGSPPHIFLQSFISHRLAAERTGMHPFYWGVFSSYARHPYCAGVIEGVAGDRTEPSKIRYMRRCNPLADLEGGEGAENPWFTALSIFKGGVCRGAVGRTEIASIAKVLRLDFCGQEMRNNIVSLCLDPSLEHDALQHPAITKGIPENLCHKDPSKMAIDFFAGDDAVSKVWRFYNPLLIYPWLMEVDQEKDNPLSYIGQLLCGKISVRPYNGGSARLVGRLEEMHPFSSP